MIIMVPFSKEILNLKRIINFMYEVKANVGRMVSKTTRDEIITTPPTRAELFK